MARLPKNFSRLSRRQFLARAAPLAAAAGAVLQAGQTAPGRATKLRAAIIGHTGKGNYGHDLDLIFNGRENVEVVAVADPDSAGRAKAAARAGARSQYADYREMLEKEKPQLVCVAPRWTDQHHAMALAALRRGAHVFLEKPVTQTLAEADELLAVAKPAALKIAVAHNMRLWPGILFLKEELDRGLIGELLEIHARGKQDHRAGGEDLIVLGVHVFDLMRFFAGDALWCTARVLEKDREVTRNDARPATEGIGPVVGDEVYAQFAFPKGVAGTFTSRAKAREAAGPYGLTLVGSKGAARFIADRTLDVFWLEDGDWTKAGKTSQWRRLPNDPALGLAAAERGGLRSILRVADDWLEAIARNRESVCSGYAGMKALEMALAVFEAGLSKTRVRLPLANREHPLTAAE